MKIETGKDVKSPLRPSSPPKGKESADAPVPTETLVLTRHPKARSASGTSAKNEAPEQKALPAPEKELKMLPAPAPETPPDSGDWNLADPPKPNDKKFKIQTADDGDDGDGTGNGGGYGKFTVASDVRVGSGGLLWHSVDDPKAAPKDEEEENVPPREEGFVTRGFRLAIDPPQDELTYRVESIAPQGIDPPGQEPLMLPAFTPPSETKTSAPVAPEAVQAGKTEVKQPAAAAPQTPVAQARPASETPEAGPLQPLPDPRSFLERIQGAFTGEVNPIQIFKEVDQIRQLSLAMAPLRTPEQFQAKTQELKDRLAHGATVEQIRPEAYALARQAAAVALGKRPYDSQIYGAIALSNNQISQMNTGEGKTLTAVMPLFLNALEGKGSMLVTVNDYLAQDGFKQNKEALELLGMKVGIVLKDMEPDQKREGYNADITYISNDTLGFDYLGDRMCTNPYDRVQRPFHAAVVDEFDQVALDEARVPLIIAGDRPAEEQAQAVQQYTIFNQVVEGLVPIEDFRVERDKHSAYLTEVGEDVVANEMALLDAQDRLKGADLTAEDRKELEDSIAAGTKLRGILRKEGALVKQQEDMPKLKISEKLGHLWHSLVGKEDDVQKRRDEAKSIEESLAEVRAEKAELQEQCPGYSLYDEQNMWRLRYFHNALEARGLFRRGKEYIVQNGEVQIVDEFKGRTSEGRRFSNGLHQALEVKEGVEVHPETETVAAITYPNLLRQFQRLSGMTGTAESSKEEFEKLMGMQVVVCRPEAEWRGNPPSRIDHPDRIFRTKAAKMEALRDETQKFFDEGTPVLIGSNTVDANKRVSAYLDQKGVPNQPFNTENVKTNTPEENQMIAQAGQSGVVTAATNMAGRGVDIKPDKVNYKALVIQVASDMDEGKPVVVNLDSEADVARIVEWLQLPEDPALKVPSKVLAAGEAPSLETGLVQLRVGDHSPVPDGVAVRNASDFPGTKLVVLSTERNVDKRIDNQLRGRSGRQGAPGETQFFVSLEDDLMKVYGGDNIQHLVESMDKEELTGDKTITKLVEEAQKRVQSAYAEARLQTAKYDQVANKQRTIVWDFRDRLINARPDVPPVEGLEQLKIVDTAVDWVSEAYGNAVVDKLGGKEKVKAEKLTKALAEVNQDMGFDLPLDPALADKPVREQIKHAVDMCLRGMTDKLVGGPYYEWDSMVKKLDVAWTQQIQDLEDLKQAANLQAYAEKEPFQAYIEMTAKSFDEMWKRAKSDFTKEVLPNLQRAVVVMSQDSSPPETPPR